MNTDGVPTLELQDYLRKKNAQYARDLDKSLRGSSEEFVPMVIPMNIGGMNYLAHPIGAGESGAGFMDVIKNIVSIPAKIATAPLQLAKSMVGLGHSASKPKKEKKAKESQYMTMTAPAPVNTEGAYTVLTNVNNPTEKQAVASKVALPVSIESTHGAIGPRVIAEETHGKVGKGMAKSKKPRKPRAKKVKGGSLLSVLSDAVSGIPSVFKTPLDDWIPPEVQRKVALAVAEKASGNGSPKPKAERKPNPWLAHVKAEKAKHPSKSFKEVLQIAKLSYKK
jgi:hypothetical protein